MAIRKGDEIPDAKIQLASDSGIENTTSKEFFSGKKVVLFAVPGAFTPTCSEKHLPGFIERADEFKSKGVDAVACLSVNDAFVMQAWGKDRRNGDRVVLIADGGAELTKALGLEFDGSNFGLGVRAQRFAAVVDDGVVTKLAVEKPMKFEVSSAEAMLADL